MEHLYLVVLLAVALRLWLWWLRVPGNGGKLGLTIRRSDHGAWEDAVTWARRRRDRAYFVARNPYAPHGAQHECTEAEQALAFLLENEPGV